MINLSIHCNNKAINADMQNTKNTKQVLGRNKDEQIIIPRW